jgi:hypothetical protein
MREHQVPSLSVHDSLIVPLRRAEIARAVLEKTFCSQRGVTPLLKINRPSNDLPKIAKGNTEKTGRE